MEIGVTCHKRVEGADGEGRHHSGSPTTSKTASTSKTRDVFEVLDPKSSQLSIVSAIAATRCIGIGQNYLARTAKWTGVSPATLSRDTTVLLATVHSKDAHSADPCAAAK